MSTTYYHKKSKGQNIDVTATVQYHGLKATQYFAKFTPKSLRVLRDDLIQLKIPHPKSENIVLVTHGQVEFYWTDVDWHGVLHKNLLQKLRPSDPFQQEALKELLKQLSITSVSFREVPTGTLATDQVSQNSKKRPNAYPPTTSMEPPKKKFFAPPTEPPRPAPDLGAAEDFISGAIASAKTVSKAPKVVPTFQSSLPQVKSEPVDVPLPSRFVPERRQLPFPFRKASFSATEVHAPAPALPTPPSSAPFPPIYVSSQSTLGPTSSGSFTVPAPPVPASSLFSASPPSSGLSISTFSAYPNPGTTDSASFSEDPFARRTTYPAPHKEVSETKVLRDELWDVRRQLQQEVSREAPIVKHLNKSRDYLDKPLIPVYGSVEDTNAQQASEMKALQIRMNNLQKQVGEEQRLRQEVESLRKELVDERRLRKEADDALHREIEALKNELQEERRLREEGEGVLRDIRREMAHPFIVPQLVDAFVSISKLSSKVIKS